MITYNDIYETLRKERYSDQLQPLDNKFILDVVEYLQEKKAIASKEKDAFSDTIIKTKKQLENAISLFKELIRRRRKKIMDLAFIAAETGISKRDFENMLPIEREIFENIMKSIEEGEKNLTILMEGRQDESKNKMVMFIQDIEQFLDIEGNPLGPFKKGEIANLPLEIVNILIEDKKAELVDE